MIEKISKSLLNSPGKTVSSNSKDSALPKAAVAMILHPDNERGEIFVLLIRRVALAGDPWSGQMAFPGGRYSESDRNLLGTVNREVKEEIGVDLGQLPILGTLDDVVAGGSPIRVTPYVVLSANELSINLDSKEIDDFIWIPLSFFIDLRNIEPYKIERLGQTREVPSYKFLGNQVVWGMTLRIIQDFLAKIS